MEALQIFLAAGLALSAVSSMLCVSVQRGHRRDIDSLDERLKELEEREDERPDSEQGADDGAGRLNGRLE